MFASNHAERIHALNAAEINPQGEFVLLWLHHAVRAELNPALDVAVEYANRLNRPLLVYQGLAGAHRYNSDRSHHFILAGARDLAAALAHLNIRYVFNLPIDCHAPTPLLGLLQRACVFVTEDFPAPPFPKWSAAFAKHAQVKAVAVDASCLVPLRLSRKRFDRAFSLRAAFKKLWQQEIQRVDQPMAYQGQRYDGDVGFDPFDFIRVDFDPSQSIADAIARCQIDHTIPAVLDSKGGSTAGYQRWTTFKEKSLKNYAYRRNDAADFLAVSRMSAYLHHGHVSALRLAREASAIGGPGAEKFLDELLVWRELSYHWCAHQNTPESLDALPAWAKETLLHHANDARTPEINAEQFTRGKTGIPIWDLAQASLLRHGELHNNIRMSWAKGIVQHAPKPKQALRLLIDLNHRYALDGNNPNSYGGLLWALGLFDRPFTPEQKVLGTVRGRSLSEHAERLDLRKYESVLRRPNGKTLDVCVIGAGMAGASAARALLDAGVSVRVFDKSRGAGGRMSTRRVENDRAQFDHGAQYFTARDPRFKRWIKLWRDAGVVAPWQAKIYEIDAQGARPKQEKKLQRYVAMPGQNALAKHMLSGIDCQFETTVARIERESKTFVLLNSSGQTITRTSALALCVPAPQAATLLENFQSSKAYASSASMQPCWALMISFATPLKTPFDAVFVNTGALSWIARDSSKPGRCSGECWIAHASAEHSTEILEHDAETAAKKLLASFQELVAPFDRAVMHPIFVQAHRWRYALGGRSDPNCDAHFFDRESQLGVAGDWCSAGRVEGAFLSGAALAGSLMRGEHS